MAIIHTPVPIEKSVIKSSAEKVERILDYKTLLDNIIEGKYNIFLQYDIDEIVKKIENYNPLEENEELKKFKKILEEFTSTDIYKILKIKSLIKTLNKLVSEEKEILNEIESQKTYFIYDENNRMDEKRNITYKQYFEILEYSKKILNNSNLYKALKYFGKDNVLEEINNIKKILDMFEIIEQKTSIQSNKLLKAITNDSPSDNKIGIIRISDSSKSKDLIYAGSRKELIISELIGKPYPKQMDEPGKDVGPHGDIYIPPRKVTHEFYEEPVTDSHRKLIEEKKRKIEKLKSMCKMNPRKYSEKGYIYLNGRAILIDQKTIMLSGIDPKDIDWQPLKIKLKRELSSYDIVKATSNTKLSIVNMIRAIMLDNELKKEGKNK